MQWQVLNTYRWNSRKLRRRPSGRKSKPLDPRHRGWHGVCFTHQSSFHLTKILKSNSNPLKEEKISTPALAFQLVESEYDWQYPITFWDREGEKRHEPKNTRGKVLGGSSCLNYYTWLRGSRPTYDEWVEYGGSEWSWDKCFPYFQKVRLSVYLNLRSDY
jgi:choline dehydrogenase-like flavoprotein